MPITVQITSSGNVVEVVYDDSTQADPKEFTLRREDMGVYRQGNRFTIRESGRDLLSFGFSDVTVPVVPNADDLEVALQEMTTAGAASEDAGTQVRLGTLSNAAISVRATPGHLTFLSLSNFNSITAKIPFYDLPQGDVTVGVSPIVKTIYVAANSQLILSEKDLPYNFTAAISCAAVAAAGPAMSTADGDSTALTTPLLIEVQSKS